MKTHIATILWRDAACDGGLGDCVAEASRGYRWRVLDSGVVLNDRYRLDDRVATGGMGDVWRASDLVLGRTVAVKVLLPALLTDPNFAARFRAEARMMAALHHPGLVAVYDSGEDTLQSGAPAMYLVMEYVDSQPLSQRIATAGRLSVAETLSVVAQTAQALDAAHAGGVVHRDIKPSNLLVRPNGSVVVVDFGVARSAAVTSVTGTNAVLGTALYMAPEQASGRPVSPATDIYALGAVAYHCLAGHPPFTGGNPLEIAVRHLHDDPPPLPADVPAPVRALVERTLAKDPADRYPTAAALANAARAAMTPGARATAAVVTPAAANAATAAGSTAAVPAPASSVDMPVVAAAALPGRRRRGTTIGAMAAAAVLALAGLAAALAFTPDTGSTQNERPPTQAPQTGATGGKRTGTPTSGSGPSTPAPLTPQPTATGQANASPGAGGPAPTTSQTPSPVRTTSTPSPTRSQTTAPAPQTSPSGG